ncbi:nucleoside-diphosphate sugar epimerase [Microlunatus endophyticus]|uniref:Nucleoside-diphosphate sugar epimerase n=1 Tax=Microlunatus endophyticus TaxID=1716077 RepID=A0A917W8X4_9ACTN|nr:NAD(P)H-binding protein [Microlunatus endophyticus]GGL80748.1 nucleoside-diphosphate sugar epimerase [Microlunatus endophyticus]
MSRIAIAGATGAVGRHVVAAAQAAGHETVAIARSTGFDLVNGRVLTEAVTGVDAVIDVSSIGTLSARRSIEFFEAATTNLLAADEAAGVRHHVVLSIVGAAKSTSGYYAGKAAQERLLMGSEAPWSILRATQVHEFAAQMVQRGTMAGMILVPKMRSQPVAAAEVAVELVRIADGEPVGLARDLGGPQVARMADLVRRYLCATGSKGRVLEVRMPGSMGRISADGSLLVGPDAKLGSGTFDRWLERLEG